MSAKAFIQRVVEVDGRDVPCRFFKPESDEGNFFCRVEVGWPEGPQFRKVYGVDEVQALYLAMQMAHTDLLAARNLHGRNVSWLGQQRLGFPIPKTVQDWDREDESEGPTQAS